MTDLSVFVSYGQLAVFCSDLANPFNDWTDKHVAQGFSWRPKSVSFRALVESGKHLISISVVDQLEPLEAVVVRAVEVPFDIPQNGCIEVGSISDLVPLTLVPGSYLLRCEFLGSDPDGFERVRLKFSKADAIHFAISRADSGLSIGGELVTFAEPALASETRQGE